MPIRGAGWRAGDRFQPSSRSRPLPVAHFLRAQGVPLGERRDAPLLCLGDEIVAVCEPAHVARHYQPGAEGKAGGAAEGAAQGKAGGKARGKAEGAAQGAGAEGSVVWVLLGDGGADGGDDQPADGVTEEEEELFDD